jgi:hypothetical protein
MFTDRITIGEVKQGPFRSLSVDGIDFRDNHLPNHWKAAG